MSHKLMVKTHNKTGLKYLCYTQSEGPIYDRYKGSGDYWIKHLRKHGGDITTELIYETDNYSDFKQYAINKSYEFNVVESHDWANLRIEEGTGGNTVSNKMWITDGKTDKYILKDSEIPNGWEKGRTNCVFNNSENQTDYAKKRDVNKFSESLKEAWASGKFNKRDNSKIGRKGADNVACRPEVKEKIRKAALDDSDNRSNRAKQIFSKKAECPYCNKTGNVGNMKRWHFDNCKYKT